MGIKGVSVDPAQHLIGQDTQGPPVRAVAIGGVVNNLLNKTIQKGSVTLRFDFK